MAFAIEIAAQGDVISLWVGESWTMVPQSNTYYAIWNVNWETDHPACIDLSWTDEKSCRITPTKYFSGNAEVTLTYSYKRTQYGAVLFHSLTKTISCVDNPITVSPTSVTLEIGSTKLLSYSHQNSDYSQFGTVTFSSSNTNIATVSSSGKITAKKPGTASVYVHSTLANDQNAPFCEVTVAIPTLTLSQKTLTLNLTKSETIKATLSATTNLEVTWQSSDPSVATVNSSGKVTAITKGSARITATIKGYESYESASDYCYVEVTAYPTSVSFVQDTVTLNIGQTFTMMPTVIPEGAEYTLTWSTSNSGVAKVSNGTVSARGIGISRIGVGVHNGNRHLYDGYYVNIINRPQGDINKDGKVDVQDITLLISYILNSNTSYSVEDVDIDGNGIVDVSDVINLIRIVLGN